MPSASISPDEVIVENRQTGFARGCAAAMSHGRFSGNKFGLVLKNCTVDDATIAAERFLVGIRDDVIPTQSGPVSVTRHPSLRRQRSPLCAERQRSRQPRRKP